MKVTRNLIPLASLCVSISISVSAWQVTIYNGTKLPIDFIIRHGGDLICPASNKINIPAYKTHWQKTGICCPRQLEFFTNYNDWPNYQPGKGQTVTWYPPGTGAGISCRDSEVFVYYAADGTLQAKQPHEVIGSLNPYDLIITNETQMTIDIIIHYEGSCNQSRRISLKSFFGQEAERTHIRFTRINRPGCFPASIEYFFKNDAGIEERGVYAIRRSGDYQPILIKFKKSNEGRVYIEELEQGAYYNVFRQNPPEYPFVTDEVP